MGLRSKLAQAVLNELLRPPSSGLASRAIRRGAQNARRLLSGRWDPIVTYGLDKGVLQIPLSHELPFYRLAHAQYGAAIARITQSIAAHSPAATFVDIGANVGDTTLQVRSRVQVPTLCIEANPRYFRLLEENTAHLPDVTCVQALLDEHSGKIRGVLETARGSGRVTLGEDSEVDVVSLPDLLERFPTFKQPSLIKVDTDGMDSRILRGALELLERARPTVLFEYDPYLADKVDGNLRGLLEDLARIGYRRALAFANTGEYLMLVPLTEPTSIENFHREFTGLRGQRYADLCVFHREHDGLLNEVRRNEVAALREDRAIRPES